MATLRLLNTLVGIKIFYCTLNHSLYLSSVDPWIVEAQRNNNDQMWQAVQEA